MPVQALPCFWFLGFGPDSCSFMSSRRIQLLGCAGQLNTIQSIGKHVLEPVRPQSASLELGDGFRV